MKPKTRFHYTLANPKPKIRFLYALENALNGNEWIVWAEVDDSTSALIGELNICKVIQSLGECVWRVSNLQVKPEFRNQGIGRQLVLAALDLTAEQSAGPLIDVYLDAVPFEPDGSPPLMPMDTLRTFYRSLGFTPCKDHPFSMKINLEKR